jgi:hypothetical protein
VRHLLRAVLSLSVLHCAAQPARADDGPTFHRTTPRAAFDAEAGSLVVGIPGGRAWGIESDLRPLPAAGTTLYVRLAVHDPVVREAFVRVAYYASASARTRQLAIADSAPVSTSRGALVAVPFEAPPGAVAYRVRVLARLSDTEGRSAADAISARVRALTASSRPSGSLLSRLLP